MKIEVIKSATVYLPNGEIKTIYRTVDISLEVFGNVLTVHQGESKTVYTLLPFIFDTEVVDSENPPAGE